MIRTSRGALPVLLVGALMIVAGSTRAQPGTIIDFCPVPGVTDAAAADRPDGIILTAFDRTSIWALELDTGRRYPLPETTPCAGNCSLSPDGTWLLYFNDATNAVNRMRLNGTERSLAVASAAEVEWWSPDRFLVWTPAHRAYLSGEGDVPPQPLDVNGIASVQPGGFLALGYREAYGQIERVLVDLSLDPSRRAAQSIELGLAVPFFDAAAWSPDGSTLALTVPIDGLETKASAELAAIGTSDDAPERWTRMQEVYGDVRINGIGNGEMSWSPDSTRIAFWVIPLGVDAPDQATAPAVLHVIDVASRNVIAYCGYASPDTTPNPPRLVWSPDGRHIAFAGNVPEDTRGTLLISLDTSTGRYSALSVGVYPAFGAPNVYAWGLPPDE
jgi:hypothetical protein